MRVVHAVNPMKIQLAGNYWEDDYYVGNVPGLPVMLHIALSCQLFDPLEKVLEHFRCGLSSAASCQDSASGVLKILLSRVGRANRAQTTSV